MRNINFIETFENDKKRYRIVFVLTAVAFVFAVITYGLSIKITNDVLESTSIVTSQFGNGVSLDYVFVGVIILGAFQMCILIAFLFLLRQSSILLKNIRALALMNLFFVIPIEAIYYKFMECFNFANNDIVIARSIIGICYILIFLLIPIRRLLLS